jgi:hypothetical protein
MGWLPQNHLRAALSVVRWLPPARWLVLAKESAEQYYFPELHVKYLLLLLLIGFTLKGARETREKLSLLG